MGGALHVTILTNFVQAPIGGTLAAQYSYGGIPISYGLRGMIHYKTVTLQIFTPC